MDCAHDSSLLADPLRPFALLRFTSFGESVPMPSIIQLSSVGGCSSNALVKGCRLMPRIFASISVTARMCVPGCSPRRRRNVSMYAGSYPRIWSPVKTIRSGCVFLDGGFDETDRVFAHVWSVLNIGHLQHTEGAVAVESQGHDAHCNAANLDMR